MMKYSAYDILKKVNFLLIVVVLGIFGRIAFSEEKENNFGWERKGEFFARIYQDVKEDSPYEDKQEIDAWLDLENKIDFKDWNTIFTFNLRARGEVLVNDKLNEEDMDLQLREAYLEFPRKNFSFSIGRQTLTWGKLDDVIILDRMNPQDYRWFVLLDKQERKIPTFMFKYNYHLDNGQIESVYLPEFKPSNVRFFGSDWAVFGHLCRIIEDGDYSQAVKDTIRGIKVEERDSLTERNFKNGQAGVRFRARLKDTDYTLYYMFVNNSIPTLREKTQKGNILKKFLYLPTEDNLNELINSNPTDEDLTLEREHPRTHVIGCDFETVFREYGMRGEFGLFLDTPYLRSDFSYVRKDSISVGLGIDHTSANNFYYNIQGIETVVLDYEHLFAQEEYSHLVTLTLRKDFLRGNLLFNLDCAYNFSYGDRMFNPEISYKFGRWPEVALGGFIFGGGLTSLFGRYSAKDMIYTEISYKF